MRHRIAITRPAAARPWNAGHLQSPQLTGATFVWESSAIRNTPRGGDRGLGAQGSRAAVAGHSQRPGPARCGECDDHQQLPAGQSASHCPWGFDHRLCGYMAIHAGGGPIDWTQPRPLANHPTILRGAAEAITAGVSLRRTTEARSSPVYQGAPVVFPRAAVIWTRGVSVRPDD